MAVSTSLDWQTGDVQEWTVTATADADTATASTTHVMGGQGGKVMATLLDILQASAGASLWAITTLTNSAWVATKSTAVGSGNASAQLRVRIERRR